MHTLYVLPRGLPLRCDYTQASHSWTVAQFRLQRVEEADGDIAPLVGSEETAPQITLN